MRDLYGKVALVTGAGSGIGRETALALARAGAELILCDLAEPGLRETAAAVDGLTRCRRADVVDVADRVAMRAFADRVHAEVPALDILVNNAGVGLGAGFLDTSLEDWDWIVGVNLWGVVHGLHFFVPPMAARGAPARVVNVSSMLGYWIVPDVAAYTTTKHAVFGLSESLRMDLHGTGVRVSVICPGIISTNIVRAARFRVPGDAEAQRDQVDALYIRRDYGPDRVAAAILRAIRTGRPIVPVSPEAWWMYWVNRACVPLSRYIGCRVSRQMRGA